MNQEANSLIEAMITIVLLSLSIASIIDFEFKSKTQEKQIYMQWKKENKGELENCESLPLKENLTVLRCNKNERKIKLFLGQ